MNNAGFLAKTTDMLLGILDEYVKPTLEQLCELKGIDISNGKMAEREIEQEVQATVEDPVDDIEDDEDDFYSGNIAGTVRAKNPYEVEQAALNIVKN